MTVFTVQAKVLRDMPTAMQFAEDIANYVRDNHGLSVRRFMRNGGPWQITWMIEFPDLGQAGKSLEPVLADPAYWAKLHVVEEKGVFEGFEFAYWDELA